MVTVITEGLSVRMDVGVRRHRRDDIKQLLHRFLMLLEIKQRQG